MADSGVDVGAASDVSGQDDLVGVDGGDDGADQGSESVGVGTDSRFCRMISVAGVGEELVYLFRDVTCGHPASASDEAGGAKGFFDRDS